MFQKIVIKGYVIKGDDRVWAPLDIVGDHRDSSLYARHDSADDLKAWCMVPSTSYSSRTVWLHTHPPQATDPGTRLANPQKCAARSPCVYIWEISVRAWGVSTINFHSTTFYMSRLRQNLLPNAY